MRKKLLKLLRIVLTAFVFTSFIPLRANASGGYCVKKGEKVYHSVFCSETWGCKIEDLKWYKTQEEVERAGYNRCGYCSDAMFDYEEDGSTHWFSKEAKIQSALEMERFMGVMDSLDVIEEERAASYEEGFNAGNAAGYKDGYQESQKQIHAIEESNNKTSFTVYCVALGSICLSAIIYIYGRAHIAVLKKNAYSEIDSAHAEAKSIKQKTDAIIQEARSEASSIISKAREEASRIGNDRLKEISTAEKNLQLVTGETKQNHPELARQIADVQYYLDMESYNRLRSKQHPAVRAADDLKRIATEKRTLVTENKQLHYQLDFYESLFPWLEEFKQVPSDEAIIYATGIYNSDYDAVRSWISPEEYAKLGNAEKYQLALDRWKSRKNKNSWDVGIEYERYIGYRLECEGYKVNYSGAMLGVNDMGRDLLAMKLGRTLVIQCKRWSKDKTIHEKHIFQLYGSIAVLSIENPGVRYKGVFITTATLSDTAKKCAEYCNISVVENCPMEDYPLIKCNASKTGEKIYHLPFDQQYDKVVISKNNQSFYAWTTKEAETNGFRRAYRWRPNKP